jgi:hypothetical protein
MGRKGKAPHTARTKESRFIVFSLKNSSVGVPQHLNLPHRKLRGGLVACND